LKLSRKPFDAKCDPVHVISINADLVCCMNKIIRETLFFIVASAVILPTPILILAWMTGRTMREVLFR
jgi:hypothetical protein